MGKERYEWSLCDRTGQPKWPIGSIEEVRQRIHSGQIQPDSILMRKDLITGLFKRAPADSFFRWTFMGRTAKITRCLVVIFFLLCCAGLGAWALRAYTSRDLRVSPKAAESRLEVDQSQKAGPPDQKLLDGLKEEIRQARADLRRAQETIGQLPQAIAKEASDRREQIAATQTAMLQAIDRDSQKAAGDQKTRLDGLHARLEKLGGDLGNLRRSVDRPDGLQARLEKFGGDLGKLQRSVDPPDGLRARLDQLGNDFGTLQQSVKQIDGRLARLGESLHVPSDESLPAVLLLVDTGERMKEHGYDVVYQALLEAVESSLRYTPRRKIGLLANRGDRPISLLTAETHLLVPDFEKFRKELGENRPTVGEDSSWLTGLQGAIDLLAPRPGRWRLVYLTCNPVRSTDASPEQWAGIAQNARKRQMEVRVIHLLKLKDLPSRELVELAIQSGGQYAAVLCSQESAGVPTNDQPAKRVISLLYQSLDLPAHVPH